jgi:hypothetical protein
MRRRNYFAQVQGLTLARPIAGLPIRCKYRSNNVERGVALKVRLPI